MLNESRLKVSTSGTSGNLAFGCAAHLHVPIILYDLKLSPSTIKRVSGDYDLDRCHQRQCF